ncbi:MAG: ribonuclease HII [Dialister sp.]|nr:ribonuclease HII [Dialister sp.]
MTISEIQGLLMADQVPDDVMRTLLADPRKGVQTAIAAYFRRQQRDVAERLRVEAMYETESAFYRQGKKLVAGVDEVGRGPLAGPVTVAAVILPPHWFQAGLNDSKQVSPKKREEIAERIAKEAVAVSIASTEPEEIDSLNIYEATLFTMYKALKGLSMKPEAVIVDAMPLHLGLPVVSLTHGDEKSASVAAASIVAKVYRDRLMAVYGKEYPEYGFEQNKGYGTAEHMDAIRRYGITRLHRKSFEPVKSMIYEGCHENSRDEERRQV